MFSVLTRLFLALVFGFNLSSGFAGEAPPTNSRMDGPAAMSFYEAKIALGFPEAMARNALSTGAKFKFGIVDAGFSGLREWLAENPQAARGEVEYKTLRPENKSSKSSHGFDVFRSAVAVMPDADFVLVETGDHLGQFKDILEVFSDKGVYFISMSLGQKENLAGVKNYQVVRIQELLEEKQVTLLASAGNQRGENHSFPYLDADGDGVLEFSHETLKNGKLAESNKFGISGGTRAWVTLTWNERPRRQGDFELQLFDRNHDLVTTAKYEKDHPVLRLSHKSDEDAWYYLRLIDHSGSDARNRPHFNLYVRSAYTVKGAFNGRESMNILAQFESPFIITVGAFGLTDQGVPEPSLFSSIGHTDTGEIGPHISGPGQLKLADKVVNGTSFSTPFIAALYSSFASYNTKNVVQATSTHARFVPGLVPEEATRWGIPDAAKLLSDNECVKSNRVENRSSRIEADNVVLSFDFSRNCMEGLDYYLHAFVWGNAPVDGIASFTGQLKTPGGQHDLRGWAKLHSTERDIRDQRVEIKIPLKFFSRAQFGRTLRANLKISTLAQWDPVSIAANLEPIQFTLPPAPAFGADITGQAALNLIGDAYRSGAYADVMELVRRGMIGTDLSADTLSQLRTVRATAAAGAEDNDALLEFARDDIAADVRVDAARFEIGGLRLAEGKFKAAAANFSTCMKSGGELGLSCMNGYLAAKYLMRENAVDEVLAILGPNADKLATSDNIHALALAVLTQKMSGADLKPKIMAAVRPNLGTAKASIQSANGFYYLGLLGVISNNADFARENFAQSANSLVAKPERLLSALWLKKL